MNTVINDTIKQLDLSKSIHKYLEGCKTLSAPISNNIFLFNDDKILNKITGYPRYILDDCYSFTYQDCFAKNEDMFYRSTILLYGCFNNHKVLGSSFTDKMKDNYYDKEKLLNVFINEIKNKLGGNTKIVAFNSIELCSKVFENMTTTISSNRDIICLSDAYDYLKEYSKEINGLKEIINEKGK